MKRGLYAIVDADFLESAGISLLPFAERVVSAGPAFVQLRAKNASPRSVLAWLRAIRAFAGAVPLFANDRPDLAVLAGCQGVHVGQEDLTLGDARRFAPDLRVGISTHDEAQLREAIAARPDYVAFGPVFATASKERPSPTTGLEELARAHELCRRAGVPLVAIGGIDVANGASIAARAEMGAVIRGLLPGDGIDGVTRRAAELHRLLGG